MSDVDFDPNFDIGGFAQRAKEALAPEKITAFATRVGLPQATVSKILGGGSVAGPRIDIAAKIADGLGVSLDWLILGRGDGPSEQLPKIPRYAATLAAGSGSWNEGRKHLGDVPVTLEFLQQLRRSSTANLTVLQARGDSMAPTIADQGLMVIDESVTEAFDDVFAFVLAGEARVKRFRRLTSGLVLISDNDAYPPETLEAHDMKSLSIIGQVLGVMQAI